MLKRFLIALFPALITALLYLPSCTHKPHALPVADGGFPDDVAKILVNRCATAGCHNQASYQNAGGLLLDTWVHLFDGGTSGAAVVAYSPKFSPLLYYVNTDSSLGTVAIPTMPLSSSNNPQAPLTKDEYNILVNWITNGAPDRNGNVPFASNADSRQKIYITQQGNDLLAVIDAEKKVIMRYIPVGTSPAIESPHCVRVSSDGAYAYVSFLGGTAIQKIDTRTDQVVGNINLGVGSWNIVYVAPTDTAIMTTDWTSNGRVVFANTTSMKTQPWLTGSGSGFFVYPHGITSNVTFDTTFITAQFGNVIYKYSQNIPYYKKISLNGLPPATTNANDSASPNPHEILMTPDYSHYFVTCQGTNEVRVMGAHKDTLLGVIPVGNFPQEMAISRTKPYLFVTCMEDGNNPQVLRRGSVYVIDYNTLQIVKTIYGDFYQPHGVTVDDRNGQVYIASTNSNPNGPAPHHVTTGGGRAGWYSIYDLNTLQPYNSRKYQMTVMPYSAATRFK